MKKINILTAIVFKSQKSLACLLFLSSLFSNRLVTANEQHFLPYPWGEGLVVFWTSRQRSVGNADTIILTFMKKSAFLALDDFGTLASASEENLPLFFTREHATTLNQFFRGPGSHYVVNPALQTGSNLPADYLSISLPFVHLNLLSKRDKNKPYLTKTYTNNPHRLMSLFAKRPKIFYGPANRALAHLKKQKGKPIGKILQPDFKIYGGCFDLSPENLRAVLPETVIEWKSRNGLAFPQGTLNLTRLQNEFSSAGLAAAVNRAADNLGATLPLDPPADYAGWQTAARIHGLDNTGFQAQNKRARADSSDSSGDISYGYDFKIQALP